MNSYVYMERRTEIWKKVNSLVKSMEVTANSMTKQQKQHYIDLNGISIYDRIRALNDILQPNESFNLDMFKNNYSSKLFDDVEFMKYAIVLHPRLITCAGPTVVSNNLIAEYTLMIDGMNLEYLCDDFKDNPDIVMLSIISYKQNYLSFSYSNTPMKFASDMLKSNRDFCLKIIDEIPNSFADFFELLKDDDEVAFKACMLDCDNVYYVSDRLKNDKNFIKSIVIDDLLRIDVFRIRQIISENLLNEIVVELVDEDPRNIFKLYAESIDFICSHFDNDYLKNIVDDFSLDPESLKFKSRITYLTNILNSSSRKHV